MRALRQIICAAMSVLVMAAAASAQSAINLGALELCASGCNSSCRPVAIQQLDLDAPVVHVRRTVEVPAAIAASRLPLAVTLIGTMSAEVRWNGASIGRNGVVGENAASETPGQFRATILVPRDLVRPGPNVVDVRMSAHHRWLPVRSPVQRIGVGFYEGGYASELRAYWPALLTAGVLLLSALYFGAAAASAGPQRRDALILVGVAAGAAAQLMVETSRSFVDYAYPWHIARIAAIVLLAALTAALLAAYTARRFAPAATRRAVTASLLLSTAAIAALPTFDARTWASLFATAIVCLLCATTARARRDGRIAMVAAGSLMILLLWGREGALDRGYYLGIAALLAGLVAEQAFGLRRLHSGLAAERARSGALARSLAAADGGSIVAFRDGAAIHRFREAEIVRITAADDFCELTLTSRRPLLVGGTLKALAESLPERFLRVHKSTIVNLAHVATVIPRPGGGHQLVLGDGSSTPVGRTYRDIVLARLKVR